MGKMFCRNCDDEIVDNENTGYDKTIFRWVHVRTRKPECRQMFASAHGASKR